MDVPPRVPLLAHPPRRERGALRLPSTISPPLLVPSDFIQGVEDVAAVFHGVVLGGVEPVGTDHAENLVLVRRLPFPCVADDVAPGRSSDPLAETEDGINVGLEVPSAVPTEDELVGVDVDVLVADTVVGPVAPSLEVGEEPMHPRQHLMGWRSIDGAQVDRLVAAIRQAPVGRVAVGDEQAADGGVVPDESVQALAVDVDDALQAASRRVLPGLHLDGTNHENLADGAAPLTAAFRLVLAAEGHVRLVDLDHAAQRTPVRIDHRPAKLVEQKPGRLVTAEAQLRLELKGGHPVGMGGEKVGG